MAGGLGPLQALPVVSGGVLEVVSPHSMAGLEGEEDHSDQTSEAVAEAGDFMVAATFVAVVEISVAILVVILGVVAVEGGAGDESR